MLIPPGDKSNRNTLEPRCCFFNRLNLIKRFEGFSPTIYICPAGYPTIGYGHVVLAYEQDQVATGITQAEATELLRKDVRIAERAVLQLISVPLTNGKFAGVFHLQSRCWGRYRARH